MEILYKIEALSELNYIPKDDGVTVRWLNMPDDDELFIDHLRERYPDRQFRAGYWLDWEKNGTPYCGLIKGGRMVARAAAEKYSADTWETADVRVWAAERGNGYAKLICHFVTKFILESGKAATCRTEEDNAAMRRVIEALGFKRVGYV